MPAIIDKEKMKLFIIQSLEKCALEKPLADISLRDIANAANINHATILYYFSNKAEILIAYAEYIADKYLNPNLMFETKSNDLVSEIYQLFQIDEKYEHTKISIQLYALSVHNKEIHGVLNKVYENYRTALRNLLKEKFNKNMDIYADTLLMAIEGALVYRLNANLNENDIKNIIKSIIQSIN